MVELSMADKLQAAFKASEYEWRVQQETKDGNKVMVLCYVTNRAIQDRLDDVFGPMGWKVDYAGGPAGGVMCTISAWDKENKQWVAKADGADTTEVEKIKGGYSAACKRAGVVWGIGRLLYRLPSTWVPLGTNGSHWHKCKDGKSKYWDDPPLPEWAIAGNGSSAESSDNGVSGDKQPPADDSKAPLVDPAGEAQADPPPKPEPTTSPPVNYKRALFEVMKATDWTSKNPEHTLRALRLLAGGKAANVIAKITFDGSDHKAFAREDISAPEAADDPLYGLLHEALLQEQDDGTLSGLYAEAVK